MEQLWLFLVLVFVASLVTAEVHFHEFVIQETPVKRLCRVHNSITVNGQFPGPTLEARNGDSLVITAINKARYNISLHWHGIRQMRNPWADGPEYITQCPIQPGRSYTYRFHIEEQEGTMWWHAHSKWLRATVYGALVVRPPLSSPNYPFQVQPKREITLLLGEWWDRNPMDVLNLAQFTGDAPLLSDAYTINGQPGDFYRCSSQETLKFLVESGETILLRVINSALNQDLFFAVANHKLTVVAADASYTKPFSTKVVMLGTGQTTDLLLTADQPPGHYYMAAQAYNSGDNVEFDNTTTTAILQYKDAPCVPRHGKSPKVRVIAAKLPGFNDTATAAAFGARIKSPSKVKVPLEIDEDLFFTVGLGLFDCPTNTNPERCQGPDGTRLTASINNVSFVFPRRNSIAQAYYQDNSGAGVFTTDFPPRPPLTFDYTGNVNRALWQPRRGTKVYKLKFNSKVQIILQGTSILTTESHPMHLHGYEFYVVGTGIGNFDPNKDTSTFNLVDPPRRNTIGTPPSGWVAIRFVADNPGVWLMHCHIDTHLLWGLAMVFLVENGEGHCQSVQSQPLDLPQC